MDEPGWVLWSGTVGLESPLAGRVAAAQAWGYTRLSLSPLDVARSGRSPAELGRWLRDEGLEVVLDPVGGWHPGAPRAGSRFAAFGTEECLRMCADLSAVSLTALAQATSEVPVEALAEPFGVLCDRAADLGALVHLEPVPMTVVRGIAEGWAVVDGAGRTNGGLVVDAWHFFRGDADFEALAEVPGDRIFAVQVDDAHAEVRGTMREDTQHRLLPGDGSFDLLRLLRQLDEMGGLSWVGPEVISPATAAMDPVDAARLAGDRTRALLSASVLA